MIPRPPEILPLALEGEKHLSPLPLVAEPWASTTQLIRLLLTNLGAPLADGLRGHGHPAVEPEFCHLPEAPTASEVQPHRVTDDFDRQPGILLFRGSGRGVHPATLSHGVATRQVDNASGIVFDKLTAPAGWVVAWYNSCQLPTAYARADLRTFLTGQHNRLE